MSERPEDRVDRIVGALLRGRRLKLRGGDAEEKEAIVMAARLAAARRGSQLMSPAFRQRLVKQLGASPPTLPTENHWVKKFGIAVTYALPIP